MNIKETWDKHKVAIIIIMGSVAAGVILWRLKNSSSSSGASLVQSSGTTSGVQYLVPYNAYFDGLGLGGSSASAPDGGSTSNNNNSLTSASPASSNVPLNPPIQTTQANQSTTQANQSNSTYNQLAAIAQGTALAPATAGQAATVTGYNAVTNTQQTAQASGVGYNIGGLILGSGSPGAPTPAGTIYENGMIVTTDPSGF